MKKAIFFISMCAGIIILAACATTGSQQSGGDLTGKAWALTDLGGNAPLAGTSVTIQFKTDGTLAGSAGCNQYGGKYTTSGSNITISNVNSTMMACPQPVMDQETAYLKALGEAKTYTVKDTMLTLLDASGKSLATYQVQSQSLAGTAWDVISYNNGKEAVTSVLASTTLTMEFGSDGTLSGNSGCNTYNGTYSVTGDQIKIGTLATTRMACEQDIMDQETQFLAALESAATYSLSGTGIELRKSDGALAVDGQVKSASSENTITDIVWQWTSVITQSTQASLTVTNPENYTITFKQDGTLEGKADCNSFSGTYSQENGFTIKLGATTLMYCGDNSLDQQYLQLLGSVAAGGPDGTGNLALETAGGAQRMIFINGGAAK